jgi:D-aminopeptidase
MPTKPRARELGIPFEGKAGSLNAITDVPGVRVGHVTLIREGKPDYSDAVRTGVTAIIPKPSTDEEGVFAGWFRLNGSGELTGTASIEESGILDGPILTTNTLSVGTVHAAVADYSRRHGLPPERWGLPVVGETWDGYLNDIRGLHVRHEDAFEAIDRAATGSVPEGNVGGGTGNVCYDFKGGIGTSSRLVPVDGPFRVGVLVQANHGVRDQLLIAGVPVGRNLTEGGRRAAETGSILGFVATDAPLLPHQLTRLARRCSMGIARSGSVSGHSSGDLFLAFSTANNGAVESADVRHLDALADTRLDPFFRAVVAATEEAVVNCLVAAETMVGVDRHLVEALPKDRVATLLRDHGRLE